MSTPRYTTTRFFEAQHVVDKQRVASQVIDVIAKGVQGDTIFRDVVSVLQDAGI